MYLSCFLWFRIFQHEEHSKTCYYKYLICSCCLDVLPSAPTTRISCTLSIYEKIIFAKYGGSKVIHTCLLFGQHILFSYMWHMVCSPQTVEQMVQRNGLMLLWSDGSTLIQTESTVPPLNTLHIGCPSIGATESVETRKSELKHQANQLRIKLFLSLNTLLQNSLLAWWRPRFQVSSFSQELQYVTIKCWVRFMSQVF